MVPSRKGNQTNQLKVLRREYYRWSRSIVFQGVIAIVVMATSSHRAQGYFALGLSTTITGSEGPARVQDLHSQLCNHIVQGVAAALFFFFFTIIIIITAACLSILLITIINTVITIMAKDKGGQGIIFIVAHGHYDVVWIIIIVAIVVLLE